MREWIVGLRKAARLPGDGVSPDAWAALEKKAGRAFPPELRELYEAMNGGALPPDVNLYPADEVFEHSKSSKATWVFGTKGRDRKLFSVRGKELKAGAEPPPFAAQMRDDQWAYGVKKGDFIRYFGTLEEMLVLMVPPVETEDIGETTYAQALSAVAGALKGLQPPSKRKKRK